MAKTVQQCCRNPSWVRSIMKERTGPMWLRGGSLAIVIPRTHLVAPQVTAEHRPYATSFRRVSRTSAKTEPVQAPATRGPPGCPSNLHQRRGYEPHHPTQALAVNGTDRACQLTLTFASRRSPGRAAWNTLGQGG
jgi:hypothetical protein